MLLRTCTFLTLVSVTNVPLTSGETMSQSISGNYGYNVQTNSRIENGIQIESLWITGKGVDEHLEYQFPSPMELSVNNLDGHLIIADPNNDKFLIYSDDPGELVIMKDGVCTMKLYTTSGSKITSTTRTMSDSECSLTKKKASMELERNRIYWEKWSNDLNKNMEEAFPPGFPFHNQQPSSASSGSSSILSGNILNVVPSAVNNLAEFGTKLASKIKTNIFSRFSFNKK